jgi:hypothetical protein
MARDIFRDKVGTLSKRTHEFFSPLGEDLSSIGRGLNKSRTIGLTLS